MRPKGAMIPTLSVYEMPFQDASVEEAGMDGTPRGLSEGRHAAERPPDQSPSLEVPNTGLASTRRWGRRPLQRIEPIVRSLVREHGPAGSWAPPVSRETCGQAALGARQCSSLPASI